jgi:DNA-binding NtrC family response regulator
MARLRSALSNLGHLLDAVAEPIYALDDEQRIVFCNKALLDWVGRTPDELLGCQCSYRTPADLSPIEAVAAGLCPPPAALAGRRTSGVVACTDPEGRLSRRQADFVPLRGEGDTLVGVVVSVAAGDLSEDQACAAAGDDEAARLHERVRTLRHQMARRYRVDRLVGDSPAMRQARAQVELACASRASVLVVGPPGSGRQHVASAIHYAAGPEKAGAMVPLACAVLDQELIASTLSALPGRHAISQGPGATLLLTDVEQLAPEAQFELARVLSGRAVGVRTIATARQRLEELARRGEFRDDLAALLSTLVIELPPLAERRADVPLLAQLVVEECNARSGKQVQGLTPEAMDSLAAYGWPGNVDELIRLVREAYARSERELIGVRDLPEQIHLAAAAAAHPRRPEETIVLDEFLARVERELLQRAMARAKGNKTKAARLLGLTRPRLYRRLVQLGLEAPGADGPARGGEP